MQPKAIPAAPPDPGAVRRDDVAPRVEQRPRSRNGVGSGGGRRPLIARLFTASILGFPPERSLGKLVVKPEAAPAGPLETQVAGNFVEILECGRLALRREGRQKQTVANGV